MKYCPSCGYGIQNSFSFCPRCGNEVPETVPAQAWREDPELPESQAGTAGAERAAGLTKLQRNTGRSRIRLEELDMYEPVQPRYTSGSRDGYSIQVEKDYVPPWKDIESVPVSPGMMRYRDTERDRGGFCWWLLGFLLPLAGFILYLSCRERQPERARSVGSGAFSMLVLLAVLTVVFTFLYLNGYLFFV